MRKLHCLPFLSILFLFSYCSDDDTTQQPEPEPDPDVEIPVEETVYEIPAAVIKYYEEVDFSLKGEDLLDEVATLSISKHTSFLDYGQRHDFLYLADADPDNSGNIILIYSGESRDKREYTSGNNSHDPQTFNTEHVFPQSKIGNTAKGDLHHLKPADVAVNSSRGNHPFTAGEGEFQLIGGNRFFPGEEWIGDVARMIMYVHLRYDEPFEEVGSLELFLEWNAEDPVSEIETQRNAIIQDAQGNRNPFIDNPHIATRIWGGDEAQNRWDGNEEPEENDEEAPSIPSGLSAETSFESLTLTWEASTDNDKVAKYRIFMDGETLEEVNATSITISDLIPGTSYTFSVVAIDASGNTSEASDAIEATTLVDTEAPSVPTGLNMNASSATAISIGWEASTDNAGILNYDLYLNAELHSTIAVNEVSISDLEPGTTYILSLLARDIYGNVSGHSNEIEATTSEEGDEDEEEENAGSSPELFFSEYVEGSSNNKALEIVNLTGGEIDLASYSIRKIVNDREEWVDDLPLTGTLAHGEVFVAAHSSAGPEIIEVADIKKGSGPLNFNGNDPVGLFKDGVLLDMIGIKGGEDFAKDQTWRRKSSVTTPSGPFDAEEWEILEKDTFDGLGIY